MDVFKRVANRHARIKLNKTKLSSNRRWMRSNNFFSSCGIPYRLIQQPLPDLRGFEQRGPEPRDSERGESKQRGSDAATLLWPARRESQVQFRLFDYSYNRPLENKRARN